MNQVSFEFHGYFAYKMQQHTFSEQNLSDSIKNKQRSGGDFLRSSLFVRAQCIIVIIWALVLFSPFGSGIMDLTCERGRLQWMPEMYVASESNVVSAPLDIEGRRSEKHLWKETVMQVHTTTLEDDSELPDFATRTHSCCSKI